MDSIQVATAGPERHR